MMTQSSRDFAMGLFEYARTRRTWELRILMHRQDMSPASISRLCGEGMGAIILLNAPTDEEARFIAQAPLKIVSVNYTDREKLRREMDVSYVMIDDERLGRDVANKFLSTGHFQAYAFFGVDNSSWTLLRGKGFADQLKGKHIIPRKFLLSESNRDAELNRANLERWIASLPQPTAIFASTDACARTIANACRKAGIDIPGSIAIIGVDNDEVHCLTGKPDLSSYQPDHRLLGETCGRELERLLGSRTPRPITTVWIREFKFIERESSRIVTTGSTLAQAAESFILRNANRRIRATDVSKHLGVSRRLLDLRFGAINGKTVTQAITDAHIQRAKGKLLQSPDAPVAEIAADCGFESVNYFFRVFRRCTGKTPNEWRRM